MSLNRNTSPSDFAAAGMHDVTRQFVVDFADEATLTVKTMARKYVANAFRILSVKAFRRTAGGANATTLNVRLNGTDILSSDISFAQGDGANLSANGTLDTGHADYDDDNLGINAVGGSYLDVDIGAVETVTPSGLTVQVVCQYI